MKKVKFAISFLIILVTNYSNSQVTIPFLQPFESFDYANKPDYLSLEVASSDLDKDTSCPSQQRGLNGYGYSWLLSNNSPQEGKSLKLTVRESNQPCLKDTVLERSEILFNLPTLNNTPIYVKWNFMIPDNGEFPDDTTGGDNHIIFQLKANDYHPENGGVRYSHIADFPILLLNYVHNPAATNKKRDLYIRMNSANMIKDDYYSEKSNKHRLKILNAVNKGEWNEIILKLNLSTLDDKGYYQVWINKNPVVKNTSLPGTIPEWNTFISEVEIEPNQEPSKIRAANVFTDDNTRPISTGIPMANNIKFGHYRPDYKDSHSIYIDNIKVTKHSPLNESSIGLLNNYCNNYTTPADNQIIKSEDVSGATNYKFRFENEGKFYWINSPKNEINLLDYDFIKPNTDYNIQVRAEGATFYLNYGRICSIKTATHTKLRSIDCNDMESRNFDAMIGALKIHNATNYKFRFRDLQTSLKYWGNSPNTFIKPSSISGLRLDREYEVQVKATNLPDFDPAYGEKCKIKFINYGAKNIDSKIMKTEDIQPLVYPNPFNTSINLDKYSDIDGYKVYDLNGKKVSHGKNVIDGRINLENLVKGMYFVEFQMKTKFYYYKILKK